MPNEENRAVGRLNVNYLLALCAEMDSAQLLKLYAAARNILNGTDK